MWLPVSKVKFDYDSIQSVINPSLDNVVNKLDQAVKTVNNTRIPVSFAYRGKLTNVVNNMQSIRNNIRSLKNKMRDTNTRYDSVLNNSSDSISKIEVVKITD